MLAITTCKFIITCFNMSFLAGFTACRLLSTHLLLSFVAFLAVLTTSTYFSRIRLLLLTSVTHFCFFKL